MHSIYEFVNPETSKVIYVGRTNNPRRRFMAHLNHIKTGKYVRHPFKCKIKSLFNKGFSYDNLMNCFKIIKSNLPESEAITTESYYINELYGITNLLNIATNTEFGGDVYTCNPNLPNILNKLKGRIPWNKDKKFPGTANKTSFTVEPRIKYIIISPDSQTFELIGQYELKIFCNDWKKSHNAVWVKDPNWISPTAFKINKPKGGWSVTKVILRSPSQ